MDNTETVEKMNQPGTVVCCLPDAQGLALFCAPEQTFCAMAQEHVNSVLSLVEAAAADGYYAAGFISYEAAPVFDSGYAVHSCGDFPLVWFGIYSGWSAFQLPPDAVSCESLPEFQPEMDKPQYVSAFEEIRRNLEAGNIYQANFTFRNHSASVSDPAGLFLHLLQAHPVPYAAFVNTGKHQIVSLSPELFLEKSGRNIFSSPMKGTAKRHPLPEADAKVALELRRDLKNRAENLMIVDMVRNDLGRVCEPGSISVNPLFNVDTYNTVHQMISTVHGQLPEPTSLSSVLRATFPPASITGAPKISAMRIINKVEKSPRKVYTGSIGCIVPDGDFCLNVAIRTLICDNAETELGIGGGIVYDSKAGSEWDEAMLKSRFCTSVVHDFKVLETMLYQPDTGILYRDEHLRRAAGSQMYFGRKWDAVGTGTALDNAVKGQSRPLRLRLLLRADGTPEIEAHALDGKGGWNEKTKLCLAADTTDREDLFLYHKTTNREFYNRHFAAARQAGFDEIIFTNRQGEITEGAISNIFIRKAERWFTPELACGLLPGIWRSKMIAQLNAEETVLTVEDIKIADEVIIGNSVRGSTQAADFTLSLFHL